ncbi:MAG: hypothetical protein L3J59_04660 [Methylococcaceae bacterium]|nr:hypothetical protein [Methylococcaceae bacterium]
MFNIPETEKKIRSKISSYKSSLNREKKTYGQISDGGGKRYLLFCLYFVLNDLKKSEDYFNWYLNEFTDDVGEPIQKLCWAISLHRMNRDSEAKQMLCNLMLSNLYVIPFVIGQEFNKIDMWHSSNYEAPDFVEYIPQEVIENIKESELIWIRDLYESFEFRRVRKRYIEIYHELQNTNEVKKRSKLLNESHRLGELLS